MSSTLVYSASTPAARGNNRDNAARMMAAARRQREEQAAVARRRATIARLLPKAGRVIDDLPRWSQMGLDSIGFKVITDTEKYRYKVWRADAAESLARHWADGDEVEVWLATGE